MNNHEKLKALMQELGLSYYDIAQITGLKYDSIKNQLQPSKPFPRWANLVLYVWERAKEN